ncbi:MAG: ABC transporter ATP-binding protein [Bacteroidaceae bacterium]|nr:ABC transporter ATP-binding protein [Bacteroidaceae bacterium]
MLEIKNITFGYNSHNKIIDGLNLEFNEGGIYGLLGKNGTGKSTLLYLIMGLLQPQAGSVTMDGVNTTDRNPEIMKDMFIVPEEYDLPSISLKSYINSLKPFYPNFDEQTMNECLQMFDMPTDINLGSLSMGMKKKVYMCVALATHTKLLLMDEPTNGLDIPSKSQFRKVVARGIREDQIIIISTHQVRDVELLLDHVTIIDDQKVLFNDRLNVEEPVNLEELFLKALENNK